MTGDRVYESPNGKTLTGPQLQLDALHAAGYNTPRRVAPSVVGDQFIQWLGTQMDSPPGVHSEWAEIAWRESEWSLHCRIIFDKYLDFKKRGKI
jgi:hypothetical protein